MCLLYDKLLNYDSIFFFFFWGESNVCLSWNQIFTALWASNENQEVDILGRFEICVMETSWCTTMREFQSSWEKKPPGCIVPDPWVSFYRTLQCLYTFLQLKQLCWKYCCKYLSVAFIVCNRVNFTNFKSTSILNFFFNQDWLL